MAAAAASSRAWRPPCSAVRRAAPCVEDWVPPLKAVAQARDRDFVRFTALQAALKCRCAALLHFVRHDFGALSAAAPEAVGLCEALGCLEQGKLTHSMGRFAKSLEALGQRIAERERLRIVFIGPVNAGKTTLINMLLTAGLGGCEPVLPTSPQAETDCIWKVASCDGGTASVLLDGRELRSWSPDVDDPLQVARARAEIAEYLESALSREAAAGACQGQEIAVSLPLGMLNPFGCQYCLVDTPGYTESDEYEALVAKYLRDHSHIACMVCNLNQGKAVVQSTKNMMAKSYSRTFWVLTQYDDLMLKRKKGQDPRKVADKAVQDFRNEIQEVDADARVFMHAAQVLMPEEEGWHDPLRQHLPESEAAGWLDAVRQHVKGCFLEIQQRNHVLSSQARHCMEAASDILNEYSNLRDGSSGALAANEYYVRELQSSAEEVANDMERAIQREVQAVKAAQLDHLCQAAAKELLKSGRWSFTRQQAYYQALSQQLAPMIQRELQLHLDEVVRTAHERVLATAHRLLSEAGLVDDSGQVSARVHEAVAAPSAEHLRTRYPVENFMAFSLAAGAAGTAAVATEAGGALLAGLGLRLGAASVAGIVGVAVVSFATLGYTAQKAAEVSPCWTYAAAEADVVARIRQATQWGILAEAAAGRARAQLLSGVAQFRYSFSVILLHRGTPRSVLESLFPDLPLFEEVHRSLERTCADVRAFADAPDLAAGAAASLERCRQAVRMAAWAEVVDATSPYVELNARTDSVDGRTLASLLHLRCHALVMADMFGEARESAEAFRRIFPELLLPVLYRTAAHLRFEYLRGGLDADAGHAEVRMCLQRLQAQHAERELPRELEVWFLALAASWLDSTDARDRLLDAVRCVMAEQMKERPSLERICERVAASLRSRLNAVKEELSADVVQFLRTLGTEGARELRPPEGHDEVYDAYEEVRQEYERQCQVYATGVVNSVHLLLGMLPASHLDMASIGRPMVEALLAEISRQLLRPPAADPRVEREIRIALCPVDEGHVLGLCEEWVRVLGLALRDHPLHNAEAYSAATPS